MNTFKAEHEADLSSHELDTKRRMLILEEDHKKQISDFEAGWMSESMMNQFNKRSKELINLRKMQKQLAYKHELEEAKRIKGMADELEIKETEAAKQKAVASMKLNYEQLIIRQEKEKECILKNAERKRIQMENEYRIGMESYENSIQVARCKQGAGLKRASYDITRGGKGKRTSLLNTSGDKKLIVKVDVKALIAKNKTPRKKPN